MKSDTLARKLWFMELMQRCFPFRWKKYWDCGKRDFDILMILRDIESPELNIKDRVLLSLLIQIWNGRVDLPQVELPGELKAAQFLNQEQRQLLSDLAEGECPIRGKRRSNC